MSLVWVTHFQRGQRGVGIDFFHAARHDVRRWLFVLLIVALSGWFSPTVSRCYTLKATPNYDAAFAVRRVELGECIKSGDPNVYVYDSEAQVFHPYGRDQAQKSGSSSVYDAVGITLQTGHAAFAYIYDAHAIPSSHIGEVKRDCRYDGSAPARIGGMYYLRARYYKPETGRFWTMDTYEGNKEEPLSLHKYLYCQVNPVNLTDPSGLKSYLYLIGQDTSGLPFRKSAQYLSSQLSLSPGDKVVIQNISGFEEFNKALKENTDIAELNYIGHGGPGILFIGTERDADTNITEKGGKHFIRGIEFDSKSVKDLYVGNVRWDATIHLYSCFSGMSGWS